jgi:hypothetical protein
MTQIPGSYQGAATKLDRLDAHVSEVLAAARRRNRSTGVITVILVLASAIYFGVAYYKFSDVNPKLAASVAQQQISSYMPQAETQLKQQLRDHEDAVLDAGEARFRALPEQLINFAEPRVTAAVEAAMPDVEQRMITAYQSQLESMTATTGPSADPEARFKEILGELDSASKQQIAATFADYEATSGDVITYLDMLANNQNLTKRESLQRETIASFLTLVAHDDDAAATPATTQGH